MKKTLFLGMLFAILPCVVGKAATGVFDPNAYTTISMTYSGQRFYLAVDTTAATPTLTCYTEPSLATMWQVSGEMEDPVLGPSRTIQSVWFAAQSTPETYYLRCTNYHVGYFDLRLEADGSLFYVEAKSSEPGKYLECNLFYYDVSQSIPAKYYFNYDAIYGFTRISSKKPTNTVSIMEWSRKQGQELTIVPTVAPVNFDYTCDTTTIGLSLTLTNDVDHFINRRDVSEHFYVSKGTDITDQAAIRALIQSIDVKWTSTRAAGLSSMPIYDKQNHAFLGDTALLWLDGQVPFDGDHGHYHVTVGPHDRVTPMEMFDANGKAKDHHDYMLVSIKMNDGNTYADSVLTIRRTFYTQSISPLTIDVTPNGATVDKNAHTLDFVMKGEYDVSYRTLYADGSVYDTYIGQHIELDIPNLPRIIDTAWVEHPDGTWTHDGAISYYDTTIYTVSGSEWMGVTLVNRNTFHVVLPSNLNAESRYGHIKLTYTYLSPLNDVCTSSRDIYITQQGTNATAAIQFNHQGIEDDPMRQAVHEQTKVMYAIPGEKFALPLWQDMYGWYRWYDYDSGKDLTLVANAIQWHKAPMSMTADGQRREFILLNSDAEHSQGRFETAPHFDVNQPTQIPFMDNPEADDLRDGIRVACDVSEYTNFDTAWTVGHQAGSITEPTLSYRQIFDIHHASEQADRMEKCLIGGQWMNTMEINCPKGRTIKFQPSENFILKGSTQQSELGYVFYFNGKEYAKSGAVGTRASVTTGVDAKGIDAPGMYRRVGMTKTHIIDGIGARISLQFVDEMKDKQREVVILQAPVKETGYILGLSGTNIIRNGMGYPTADSAYNAVLALAEDPDNAKAYFWIMEKISQRGGILFRSYFEPDKMLNYTKQGKLEVAGYDAKKASWACRMDNVLQDDDNRWVGADSTVYKLFFASATSGWGNVDKYRDYLTHSTKSGTKWTQDFKTTNITSGKPYNYPQYAWNAYRVDTIAGSTVVDFDEQAHWYRSEDGGNTWVLLGGGDEKGVVNDNNGSLDIAYNGSAETVIYKLQSDHFQLEYQIVHYYDPATEYGPSDQAVVSESELLNDYEVVADFSSQYTFSGTTDVEVANQHFPWAMSEFAVHYPRSGAQAVSELDGKRIYEQDLPAKGEYCILNKLVLEGGNTIEAMSGAANGGMFYFRTATRPATIFNYIYPQPACADQDMLFTCYLRNPEGTSPHVRFFIEGYNANTGTWTPINNINCGMLDANHGWYQLAIPMPSSVFSSGYTQYRFKARMTGSNENNGILIDKIRLMAKKRPALIYQAQSTCGESSLYAITRIVYPELPKAMEGAQICYQLSYKGADGEYHPMNNSDMPTTGGYYLDGIYPVDRDQFISVPDSVHNGFIVVPEATYDPSLSNTTAGQSTGLATFLDMFIAYAGQDEKAKASAIERKQLFINETSRVFNSVNELIAAKKTWADYTDAKGELVHDPVENRDVIKGYVKEKIAGEDTWVMYIVVQLDPKALDATSFRVRLTPLQNMSTRPNFETATCADERFFDMKYEVSLRVDGVEKVDGSSTDVPGNTSHDINLSVNYKQEGLTDPLTGSAKFDILAMPEAMRNYSTLTGAELATAEEAFKTKYGYSVNEVKRAFDIFRDPSESNPNRTADRDWNYVVPADFYFSVSPAVADSVYAVLDALHNSGSVTFGAKDYAAYMASGQDAFFWIRPISASANCVWPGGGAGGVDTTINVSICDNMIWTELHAATLNYTLRFGNDPRTDEERSTIPVIRATRTQANTLLPVRVQDITNAVYNEVILGWDSTRLVATNDPAWNGESFRYGQDRILQAADYQTGYYKPGDTIFFCIVDDAHIALLNKDRGDGKNQWNVPVVVKPGYQHPNEYTLNGGYWYRFKTTMMNLALSPYVNSDTLSGIRMGDAYFDLYVAPDTAEWVPNNAGTANYWNEDKNWRTIVNGQPNGSQMVPMAESQVIISAQDEETLYPIVDGDLHGNNDFGFRTATCRDIMFRPNTRIKGQELLDYNRCFIDRFYTTGQWTTFSPALKFTHTGDMFTPADMETEAKMDFAPLRFDDPANIAYFKAHCAEWGLSESQFGRSYPFAYWQNAWNASVPATYYSTDEGTQQSRTRQSAEWVNMNTTNYHYEPGNGYAILCYGPTREDGETLLYRLPKQDQTYYAYHHKSDGSYEPYAPVDINRPDFEHQLHNMSFDKDTLNAESTGGLTIRLHNNTASNQFLFGNPSMGMIDVWKFVADNNLVEEVAIMSGNAWSTRTKAANPQLFLSPHDAMLIKAKTSGTALNVVLRPEDINIITNNSLTDNAPARKAEPNREGRLSIMAYNGGFFGHALLIESDHASNLVVDGEDAQALSSGLTNNAAFNRAYTPVNVFTLCEDMALTTDMRQVVNRIPLGFAWMNDLRGGYDNTTRLYFSVQGNWETPLYLVDVLTGDSTRIIDGGSIAVATPEANTGEVAENRYYIRGGIGAQPTTDEEHVVTDIDNINQGQEIGTNNVVVYDMTGRTVMTSVNGEYDLQGLSTGVYLVRCGNKVERKIVK